MNSIQEIFSQQAARLDQIAMMIFFVTFIIGEMIVSAYRSVKLYEKGDTLTNLLTGLITFFAIAAVKGLVFVLFDFVYTYRLFDLTTLREGSLISKVGYWTLLILFNDFMFYVFHWIAHKSRFFWALHVAHHNSTKYNFTVSIRGLFLLQVFKFPLWAVMPWLGFDPLDVFFTDSIVYFYQFWVHTQLIGRLGFLEHFMQTPRNHAVHHSDDPNLLNKNLGGIFVIWDRLFGTYIRYDGELKYGIPNNIGTNNPLTVMFHEFVAIWKDIRQPGLSMKERWNLVFGDLPFRLP